MYAQCVNAHARVFVSCVCLFLYMHICIQIKCAQANTIWNVVRFPSDPPLTVHTLSLFLCKTPKGGTVGNLSGDVRYDRERNRQTKRQADRVNQREEHTWVQCLDDREMSRLLAILQITLNPIIMLICLSYVSTVGLNNVTRINWYIGGLNIWLTGWFILSHRCGICITLFNHTAHCQFQGANLVIKWLERRQS